MIREPQSWTPSELIYLFADGEADDVQKSLLFSALANDAALQAEFSDALRINAAIKDTGIDEHPPKHVTAALFEKAGFAAIPESASKVVGGSVALLGGSVFISRLRSLVVPLLSAFVGGTLALLFAPSILHDSDSGKNTIVAERGTAAQRMQPPNSGSIRQAPSNSIRTDAGKSLETARATTPATSGTNSKTVVRTVIVREKVEAPAAATPQIPAESSHVLENRQPMPLDTTIAPETPATRESVRPSEPIAAVTIEDALASNEPPRFRSLSPHDLSTPQNTSLHVQERRFAVQVRGLADLEMFPHRSYTTERPKSFENFALTGFFNFSRNHSVGIEIGREYHPHYVSTSPVDIAIVDDPDPDIGIIVINSTGPVNGGFTEAGSGGNLRHIGAVADANQSIPDTLPAVAPSTNTGANGFRLEPVTNWVGLAYQFRAAPIDRLGFISPFFQTLVGSSQFGPIGKGTLGISWAPGDRVLFNLGIEGTAVLYSNNGEWYSSRKLGLAYSAQVSF